MGTQTETVQVIWIHREGELVGRPRTYTVTAEATLQVDRPPARFKQTNMSLDEAMELVERLSAVEGHSEIHLG
jgi:hypothetical protein